MDNSGGSTITDKDSNLRFTIRELARFRKRDDVIFALCKRSGFTWDEADAFISLVEKEHGQIARRPINLIFYGTYLVLGTIIVLVATTISEMPKAIASYDWPSAKGIVISSEWKTGYDDAPYVEVVYLYSVGSRKYQSRNISFGTSCLIGSVSGIPSECVSAKLVEYPIGKEVTAYYDPANPGSSVLEPGLTLSGVSIFGVLIVVAGFPIVFGTRGFIRYFLLAKSV